MAFNTYYVAWLNGYSVAQCKTKAEAVSLAKDIADSPRWREWNNETTLKITRGPEQYFVTSIRI